MNNGLKEINSTGVPQNMMPVSRKDAAMLLILKCEGNADVAADWLMGCKQLVDRFGYEPLLAQLERMTPPEDVSPVHPPINADPLAGPFTANSCSDDGDGYEIRNGYGVTAIWVRGKNRAEWFVKMLNEAAKLDERANDNDQ